MLLKPYAPLRVAFLLQAQKPFHNLGVFKKSIYTETENAELKSNGAQQTFMVIPSTFLPNWRKG
jgi:hypothetical protein